MVIYPDREPDAAELLLSLVVPRGQSHDAIRGWSGDVREVRRAFEAGELLLIVHDGSGTREARAPNLDSWLFLTPMRERHRGTEMHRFDGPSPEAFAERLALERAAATGAKGDGPTRI